MPCHTRRTQYLSAAAWRRQQKYQISVLNVAVESSFLGNTYSRHVLIQSQKTWSVSGIVTNRCLGWGDANGHCSHQSPAAVQSILGALILGKLHKGNAGGAVIVEQQAALRDMSCTWKSSTVKLYALDAVTAHGKTQLQRALLLAASALTI